MEMRNLGEISGIREVKPRDIARFGTKNVKNLWFRPYNLTERCIRHILMDGIKKTTFHKLHFAP